MRAGFYIALFMFIYAFGLYYNVVDNDFWARLIVGKTFFQTGTILQNDFLSYTITHRWIDHEWGSSVIFYFLQSHFGSQSLFLLNALLNFGTFAFLIEVIKLRHKNDKAFELNFLFFFICIQAIIVVFGSLRCQSFTFFFFALWLYVLERVRLNGEYRLLWIMPATMLVWANIHGGCAAGLGLLAIYIMGQLLAKKPVKYYILAFIISILVIGINPYGLEYYKFLFGAITLNRVHIIEWQGLFSKMHHHGFVKFKLFLFSTCFFTLLGAVKNKVKIKDIDITKALVLVVMLVLCIKSVRFQPFFVYCVVAFLYDDFYNLFNKKLPKPLWVVKELLLYAVVSIFFVSSIILNPPMAKVTEATYPAKEVEFIKANNIRGNIFLNFHFGSYIAYKLYPNNFIIMDGRYEEVYYDNLLELLKDVHLINPGWEKLLAEYHTDMVIVDKSYPKFYHAMKNSHDWSLVLESEAFALFLSKELAQKKYKSPQALGLNQAYYDATVFNTNIDWAK